MNKLRELLDFLDTLESEKPMNQEGLEKEINRYLEPIHTADIQFEPFTQMTKCARHFAQWGYLRAAEKYNEIEYNRQRAEEEIPKDLEEAARLYAIPHYLKDIDMNHIEEYPYDTGLEAAFIAGAKWDREQMLKEAVEGEVVLNPYPTICLDDCKDYDFKDGDKVRIIIVKEDKK